MDVLRQLDANGTLVCLEGLGAGLEGELAELGYEVVGCFQGVGEVGEVLRELGCCGHCIIVRWRCCCGGLSLFLEDDVGVRDRDCNGRRGGGRLES